jgi:excisionase family DNA binding protein
MSAQSPKINASDFRQEERMICPQVVKMTGEQKMNSSNEEETSQIQVLKIEEVAHLLRICRSQVYRLIATQGLPVIQMGRSKRVPRVALSQWIEEQTSQKNQHEGISRIVKEDGTDHAGS